MTVSPVEIINPRGMGRVVLICEHASNRIPATYAGLGLTVKDRDSHAAWDPGARALALQLSKALDAPVVASTVSRLVYDCNRPPDAPGAMPEKSELIEVPGNKNLTPDARNARADAVYGPFCAAVAQVLDARGPDVAVVTVHSFSPTFYGQLRAVELGLLNDEDSRLADLMLERADTLALRRIERNQPYGPEDGVTHSLKIHAVKRDLANVMLEVRNDLLRTQEDIAAMAQDILTLLEPALEQMILKEISS
ncbi:N-formylglutamate amidohydrolase [Roseovarius sp. M141]|uniref:N-formylglutamate amidohydrolase n=1 Tax=Roseovarius sp. M141 TaxID=2583806 RepID=UPI0020CE84A6|nr:N-formylglutamate amidohydrolase [Roseovarius sp. M141]MCQ0090940.1 N-formylglutamate amidohydrolase [Roseovarius sp. M141]